MASDPKTATYIVQRFLEPGLHPDELSESPPERWEDIATVMVPARARRRKVIGMALAQSGVRPEVGGEPLQLRVLDAASAHVTTVSAVAADPVLEIG